MLTIGIEFINGRYHANPWGRNVNEAEVEWPPSPYRIIRALYDVWKRKMPELEEETFLLIIEKLAEELPVYELPNARSFNYAVYLNENSKYNSKQLIYDSFVALSPDSLVKIRWEGLTLSQEEINELQNLVGKLGFLGRSESLVRLSIINDHNDQFSKNCYPADINGDEGKDMEGLERISVTVPVAAKDYKGEGGDGWINALMERTISKYDKKGTGRKYFKIPVAHRSVLYWRRADCFHPMDAVQREFKNTSNAIVYGLNSTVLPMIEETIFVSENFHRKLIGIQKRKYGEESISERFTGKDSEGNPLKGHKHLYILPLDMDNDERLDHIFVKMRDPFEEKEISALSNISSLRQSKGKPDIKLLTLEMGEYNNLSHSKSSRFFESETPFIPTHHYRKGRGDYGEWLKSEVRRELKYLGLPEPVRINVKKNLSKRGRSVSWLDFRRSRKGEQENYGYGFVIEFPEEVKGVFSLGQNSHFGLGLFVPRSDNDKGE